MTVIRVARAVGASGAPPALRLESSSAVSGSGKSERFGEEIGLTLAGTRTRSHTLSAGGQVLAAGSLIDRTGGTADLGVPRAALAVLDVPAFPPERCPLCAAGGRPHKPGSR